MDNYARDVSRAVAAYVRAALDKDELFIFRLPIRPNGRRDAENLMAKLTDGSAIWKDIHPVMTRLWEGPPEAREPEDDSDNDSDAGTTFLTTFLAAAALHEDGTLMDESQLVTLLSHLKYAARSFCMVEGLKRKEEDPNGCTILKQVSPQCLSLLLEADIIPLHLPIFSGLSLMWLMIFWKRTA